MTQPPDQTKLKPRKTARQMRSAATVDVVVEAAARILETAGRAGYTTNAVAERAGVSVGSLYQYFPNKDAITRALIRRELEMLEAAVTAIDVAQAPPGTLECFIAVAVRQQLRRPTLAELLEVEEGRLGANGDVDPVRERVAEYLSAILQQAGGPAGRDVIEAVMALIAALVNAAAARGERDSGHLAARIKAARLGSTPLRPL